MKLVQIQHKRQKKIQGALDTVYKEGDDTSLAHWHKYNGKQEAISKSNNDQEKHQKISNNKGQLIWLIRKPSWSKKSKN